MPDIQDAMTDVKPPIWIQGLHEFRYELSESIG